MVTSKIKYVDEMICFQEVPNETSLSFSITNCPHHCQGCHSSYLAQDIGIPVESVLKDRLDKYSGLITCVLFMGGDDEKQIDNLIECVKYCRSMGYKTALYSGDTVINPILKNYFDYIKIGPYDQSKGGLDCPSTNQRMYQKLVDANGAVEWRDITSKFWNKGIGNKKNIV